MKTNLVIIITLITIIFGYAFGFITSKYATYEPTTEQCLSVCIAEFERMGC